MFKKLTLTILSIFISSLTVLSVPIDTIWDTYVTAKTTSEKIEALIRVRDHFIHENQPVQADSAIDIAIELAQMSNNDSILLYTYKTYFKTTTFHDIEKAKEYSENFLSIANRMHDNEWLSIANASYAEVLILKNSYQLALDKVNKAYYYAGLSDDDYLKIDCFLLWGKCLENTNNKIDAFRNYLNALNLAQKNDDKDAIYRCYEKLSFFYLLIGNYAPAKDYKIKQIDIHSRLSISNDSLEYMKLLSELAEICYYNKERINAEKITHRIINYANRHSDQMLFQGAIDNHKTYLSQNGFFKELATFYTVEYPQELERIASADTISFYRVKAYICEEANQIDSASYYFKEAEKRILITKNEQQIYVSNFMKRYSQFLLRIGNTTLAKEKMQASYDHAKQADYLPYLIETSHYLDSLNYASGNVQQAYQFAKLNKEYSTRQEAAVKQDAMLLMEIDNETKQRELQAKHEREHTERRHNLQYMGIIIAIVSVFIILVMLGSFRVPKVVIRSLGFFSFIFFFEFIILLADHKIMEITHHEPWKMLGIKVVIISMLLPFHHWLEHKVTHYLIDHQLVDAAWLRGKKFWNKKTEAKPELPDTSEL